MSQLLGHPVFYFAVRNLKLYNYDWKKDYFNECIDRPVNDQVVPIGRESFNLTADKRKEASVCSPEPSKDVVPTIRFSKEDRMVEGDLFK